MAEKMGEVVLRMAAVEASIVFTAVPMSQKGSATPTRPTHQVAAPMTAQCEPPASEDDERGEDQAARERPALHDPLGADMRNGEAHEKIRRAPERAERRESGEIRGSQAANSSMAPSRTRSRCLRTRPPA